MTSEEDRSRVRCDEAEVAPDAANRPQPRLERRRRRKLVIEPWMRWPAAIAVGGAVTAALLVISVARFSRAGPDFLAISAVADARLLMLWNGLFLGFVIAADVAFVLYVTHKVAGPMRVLEEALDGLCRNDFDPRWQIRRRDCLHPLAARIGRLSEKLRRDRDRLRFVLDKVDRQLWRGDVETAREMLRACRFEVGIDEAVPDDVPREEASTAKIR